MLSSHTLSQSGGNFEFPLKTWLANSNKQTATSKQQQATSKQQQATANQQSKVKVLYNENNSKQFVSHVGVWEQHPIMPSRYRLSESINETHGNPIYCVAFSPARHKSDDTDESNLKYFATCAGHHVHLYEVANSLSHNSKKKGESINIHQAYSDVDSEEEFYTCAFGGRGTSFSDASNKANVERKGAKRLRIDRSNETIDADLSLRKGPPLLCVAGKRGIIKVIDTVLQSIVLSLIGHGDTINDLKCSPTNEWLLLSASKDHSIRLWNLQHGQMIAIFAGHDGHRGQVLSVSWHHSGTKFASSAFDNSIKLWNVLGHVQAATNKSFEAKPREKFRTAIEQTPYFSTDSIHDFPGCVDCVQFIGDLILSKSVQNVAVLWKPVVTSEDLETFHTIYPNIFNDDMKNDGRVKSKVIFLRNFTIDNCEAWFIRFDSPSPYNEILALGNCSGDIKVWELMGNEDCDQDHVLFDGSNEGLICKLRTGGSAVRMVAFADKEHFVAVCDDSSIWVYEALKVG